MDTQPQPWTLLPTSAATAKPSQVRSMRGGCFPEAALARSHRVCAKKQNSIPSQLWGPEVQSQGVCRWDHAFSDPPRLHRLPRAPSAVQPVELGSRPCPRPHVARRLCLCVPIALVSCAHHWTGACPNNLLQPDYIYKMLTSQGVHLLFWRNWNPNYVSDKRCCHSAWEKLALWQ